MSQGVGTKSFRQSGVSGEAPESKRRLTSESLLSVGTRPWTNNVDSCATVVADSSPADPTGLTALRCSSFLVSGSSTSHLTQSTPQHPARIVSPGTFDPTKHFYERVLEAQLHPTVKEFFSMDMHQTIAKYCETHPGVDRAVLEQMLTYVPTHFFWSGVDLLSVKKQEQQGWEGLEPLSSSSSSSPSSTSQSPSSQASSSTTSPSPPSSSSLSQQPSFSSSCSTGATDMLILETNSCPSGQKSMPSVNGEIGWGGGYATLMKRFLELAEDRRRAGMLPEGGLAIIYDKNLVEVSGYAKQLANVSEESIYLVELYNDDPAPCARWDEGGILSVRTIDGVWQPVRAAFRYVTQQPWTRIPVNSKTFIFNSVLSCLAGGRNKLVGHKAYEALNTTELSQSALAIRTPRTICDVRHEDIPALVLSMNYRAVIKIPYSNAGQGVFTVQNKFELDEFMIDSCAVAYEKFIIQELIDSAGTVPSGPKSYKFVWDLRVMIAATSGGYRPLVLYARKAAAPLVSNKDEWREQRDDDDGEGIRTDGETDSTTSNVAGADSRSMYLTNLSEKLGENQWTTDTERLVVLDEEDFGVLGITLDGLVDGYVQAVLATVAIDKMAGRLWTAPTTTTTGRFDKSAFQSLSEDAALLSEIYIDGDGR